MAKPVNDLQDALTRFLASNPDLPEGSDPQPIPERNPSKPRLDILLDRKGRAGKQATIIAGFTDNTSDDTIQQLASELKRRLATGGSARGGEILIQGDRRKDVSAILTSLGYKSRII